MSADTQKGANAPPPRLADVASLRARLFDAGFRPVPIYNADSTRTQSPGKAPMGDDWGNQARLNPPACVTQPPHPDALNTGILCDGLRAIDVDIDNPTIAASIRSKVLARFGETPMRYRSDSPRCLLVYRAAEGQPAKRVLKGTFGKVEILGRGQQFVAFGRHPNGGKLQWIPEAPGDVALASLAAITEADIDALLAECAPSIGGTVEPRATDRTHPSTSTRGLRADSLQVLSALHAIPNEGPADWEGWNRIGMAIWAATGGAEAGRAAFHAWSEQHPDYDATETDRRWDHYRVSPPTSIGAGTLFHAAKTARPHLEEPPLSEPPTDPEDPGYWGTLTAPLQDAEVCGSPAEVDPAQPPQKSSVIDPRTWTAPAPLRKWLIDGWIPIGYVTGLYGDGAVGKSLLAQQLLTSTATGHPWLGLPVQRGPAFGFMCEDDPDELHRRQEGINRVYGIDMSMLELLRYSSRVGFDNLLMTFDERNRAQPTDLMAAIGTYLAKFRPRLVVLDTLSDVFGGDEIKRAHARMFVQGVGGKIAREFDCAVAIAAHPSLAGLQSGKGTGGSTAWNNTFRSRLYMTHPDEEGNSENRILSRMKANYAPKQGEITMRWDNGCFVEVATTKASDGMQWPEIKAIFDEIDRKWKERDPWSNAPQTRREGRYLPLWAFTTFGLPEKVTAKYLEGWLTSGHLRVSECDGRSKRKGLRVANWLTPSREDDHDWE